MIYCICNNINTEAVDRAASRGAKTAACVQRHCGTKFNCGQCRESITARLNLVNEAPLILAAAE